MSDWVDALKNIPAKGYRRTKNGRFEAFVSDHSKTVMLGTHDTVEEAKNASFNYRADRLVSNINRYGLNPDDAVVYENNYLVFDNGMIFNLQGEQMTGCVGRGGYRHGIFNGHNRDHHKVIADCFIPNPDNLRDVNHKNGNKLDIRVDNLERTTHADNVSHSYKNGLQTRVTNIYGTFKVLDSDDLDFIRTQHLKGCLDKDIAKQLNCSREVVSRKIREMNLR